MCSQRSPKTYSEVVRERFRRVADVVRLCGVVGGMANE